MPNDSVWVDVLPSLDKFVPHMQRTLGGLMPRAGQTAGQEYAEGFAKSAVSGVEAASQKLAAARRKEEDAAGKVRVAEAKLQELRDSGKAKVSQLVAAEENLAKSQRNLTTQQEGTQKATKDLSSAQEKAAQDTAKLDDSMDKAGKRSGLFGGALGKLGGIIGGLSFAAAAKGLYNVGEVFDDVADTIRAGTGATGKDLESMVASAKLVGTQVPASFSDVGKTVADLNTRLGLTGPTLEKLTKQFLEAGRLTGQAIDVNKVSAAFTVFGVKGEQTTRVMDELFQVSQATGIGINELADGMAKGAPALAQFGFSAGESAVLVGMMDKAGLDANRTLMGLSRALATFAKEGKNPQKALQDTVTQIQAYIKAGDQAKAINLAATLFGTRGAAQFVQAVQSGTVNVERLTRATGQTGDTILQVAEETKDFAERWIEFKNQVLVWLEPLGSRVFGGLALGIQGVNTAATFLVNIFQALPGPVQATVGALVAFRVGMLLLNGPLEGLKTGAVATFDTIRIRAMVAGQTVSAQAGVMATAGAVARAGWAGFMGLLGGPVGLAIAGVTLAIGVLSSRTSDSAKTTEQATAAQQSFADALRQTGGVVNDTIRTQAAKALQERGLLDLAERLGASTQDMVSGILGERDAYNRALPALQAYKQSLEDRADALSRDSTWGSKEAAQIRTQAAAVQDQIDAYTKLAGEQPKAAQDARQVAAATGEAAQGMGQAAAATGDWTAELEDAQQAASDAKKATDLLKFSLDILTGKQVDLIQVESAFESALAQADGAMKNLSGSVLNANGGLNLQSAAGRKASDVLLNVRNTGNQLIATMVEQGATAEQVTAKDAQLRDSFIKSATQMGINDEAAKALADQILGIPAERQTKITADTAQAAAAVNTLQTLIDGLRGRTVSITARATMDTDGMGTSQRMGTFAAGGWTGPGGKYEPKGVVHGNEYVEPSESVNYYRGTGIFEALHRRTIPREALAGLRGYSGGGPVAPVSIVAELDSRAYEADMDQLTRRALEPVQPLVRALQWARSQVGKPYIWGGSGPAGWDCSGFMGSITNVIRGQSPYARVGSTASFPWAGFAPGYGRFTIGSTKNAGGGIGHMAGTLLGVNVESAGGVGVRVGGAARGAGSSLFATRAHLLDNGGPWPSGSVGVNLSGGIERVLSPEHDRYWQRFVDVAERVVHGGGRHRSLIDQVNLYAQDNRGVYRALDDLEHRLRVADLGGRYAWTS